MEEAQQALTARQFRRWVAFFDMRPARDPVLVGLAVAAYETYLTRTQVRALFETVESVRPLSEYVLGEVPEVEEEDELEGADLGTILEAKLEMHRQRRQAWFASMGLDADGKPVPKDQLNKNSKAFEKAMR